MSSLPDDIKDAVKYTFVWHALTDACQQCRQLNGKRWTDQDLYQDTLYDVFYGDIWDLNINMPLTHGGSGVHCRCTLEVQAVFDWAKIREFNRLHAVLNMEIEDKPAPRYITTITSEPYIPQISGEYAPPIGNFGALFEEINAMPYPNPVNLENIGETTDLSSATELKNELSTVTEQVNTRKNTTAGATEMLSQKNTVLDQSLRKTQHLLLTLSQLQTAALAVQAVLAATGDPFALLSAGASVIGLGISIGNLGQ